MPGDCGRGHLIRSLAMVAIFGLAGCASFRSEPSSIVSPSTEIAALKGAYARATVLAQYGKLTTEESRVAYRNEVAYVWIAASDATYDEFVQDLAAEVKGTNFGSNMAVLLLNGVAVVSGNEARRALAAASATVVGGTSTFNRDILQDQTVGAVITAAEARRTRELTEIRRKLVQTTTSEYPLGDALGEIGRLNRAANLNRASSELAAGAAADLAAAEEEAKQVVNIDIASADVHAMRVAFAKYVKEKADDAALKKLRDLLGAKDSTDPVDLKQNIIDAYAQKTQGGKSALDALTDQIKSITGQEFKL